MSGFLPDKMIIPDCKGGMLDNLRTFCEVSVNVAGAKRRPGNLGAVRRDPLAKSAGRGPSTPPPVVAGTAPAIAAGIAVPLGAALLGPHHR